MRALTFSGVEAVRYEQVPDPRLLSPFDALVQVKLCAICGSDLHVYHGRESGLDCGTVMGHEFVGEVVEIGAEVRHLKKGDLVACPFTNNCGSCFYCLQGLTCRCEKGALFGWVADGHGLHGGQAELVRVPLADATLFTLPSDVSLEDGLLLGDILSTGYFAAHMAEVQPQRTYAVIGCGPVGMMAIVGLRAQGAERIYAIDSLPDRLAMARQFGAIPINFKETSPLSELQDVTEGRGADAVLEVVGNHSAARTAMQLVRPGGIISVVGVHNEPHFAFSPAEAYDKNITYKVGRCPARYYMDHLVALVRSGQYPLRSIFTHRMSLAQGQDAYQLFASRDPGCMKILLTP